MIGAVELLSAFLLDLAIGDPRWLPHPVRIIGSTISRTEKALRKHFRTPSGEKIAGILLAILITVTAYSTAFFICKTARFFSNYIAMPLGTAVLVYLTSTTIAVRELINSARLILKSVKENSLEDARKSLGMIVGRDTHDLSDKEVLKAAMESLAENLSDGIIAPVFYLIIGGLPLAMAYKAVNTLDSMVGYRNNAYINFGWAAARLDDIANYIPARITGMLIVIVSFFVSRSLSTVRCSLKTMLRDGRNHTSPNSGIPEAAMAGALGIRMGGPSTYGGITIEKPYIGEVRNHDYVAASEHAITITKAASLTGIGVAVIILAVRGGV
ncbi:MAG: cobalamin biosynthesis protein CobD [Nitrospirae bacterium]|nr:cobalamin biosynthesis protein CobD [Nitrospirota bacterium]